MAIWRGTGGSGESTSDSTINITTTLANQAAASAAAALVSENAAEAAQAAAQTAETNAETAETNAATSATNAASSATAAASSATSAASSASSASTSASTATTKASEAAASASSAATSASSASTSASTATTKAAEASSSATAAASSATSASTSATAASSSASAAATSATNAATSATSAATSASTATTQASNASSSASSAASSATAAAASATTASTQASAASTSATNAASSASSAATSASTATTQASNASTSATNAAASASTASTQATNAAASATTASTQASNASTSATNAASSASSASTSASNAASSAASAAAALDSFDDRYLGSKTSDPTLDNDGNALLVGALYYNSTTQAMKVYDGANWIAASAAGSASMNVYKYIATNGQTTFSGAAAVGGTMSYTSGNIIVFLNGASLDSTDYTATNGTSVVLAVAARVSDEVVVVAFKSFTVADTYSVTAADAQFLPKASPSYTGTLTGGTGVVNLGSGQFYKDASGNVGIGTSSPSTYGSGLSVYRAAAGYSTIAAIQNNAGTNDGAKFSTFYQGTETASLRYYFDGSQFIGQIYTYGPTVFVNGASASEKARIDSSGNLLLGTTTATGGRQMIAFDNAGQSGTRYIHSSTTYNGLAVQFLRANNSTSMGGIYCDGANTTYQTSSDYRLKENIQPMVGGLDKVMLLKPCTYKWKDMDKTGEGFIAHELKAVVSDCVYGEKDAVDAEGNPQYQGIDTSFLVATLTAAIQEQQALITTLTERITALEGAK